MVAGATPTISLLFSNGGRRDYVFCHRLEPFS